jgi:predicted nucleic acid-binding Zn ribbon protein
MSFTPLGDALDEKMKGQKVLSDQIDASEALEIAENVFVELFGAELAVHAKPLFLKNRTLTVSCASTAMASEIRLNQAKIVEAINNRMGKNEVDRIRYLA